jgi:acyl-CoA synthetase (AMP-forming)/AMP-acid ligase II
MSSQPWSELGDLPDSVNMASFLSRRAVEAPDEPAIRVAKTRDGKTTFEDVSFARLDQDSGRIAAGLAAAGLEPGMRASVFVKPGVELIAITFGLLKLGAVPVLIDPGMGPKNVLACVEKMQPTAFIGIPAAHVLRRLMPRAFRTVKLDVVATGPMGGVIAMATRAKSLAKLTRGVQPLAARETHRDDEAAILFTSGSTGPPKGVTYTHGMFEAQVRALRATYGIEPGEIDVACLPVFALFSPALGMTCVFPELNPSKPATCDPAKIVGAIQASGATTAFGSPAIWRRVVPHCIEHGIELPSLKRVLIAGAPVPMSLIEGFHQVLASHADVHTPYGATECLPVSSACGRDLVGPQIRERVEAGEGTCVGKPAAGIDLRIIRIGKDKLEDETDTISTWSGDLEVAPGQRGEILVRGPVVTRNYKFEPGPTALAKIPVGVDQAGAREGEVWHRIGDVAYFDDEGRIWFCGRKSHRLDTTLGTIMPVPVENVFNTSPAVFRSALVGVGKVGFEEQVLVVQPEPGHMPTTDGERSSLAQKLFDHVEPNPVTAGVVQILFKADFPVDVRHNAKIHRGELKTWATQTLADRG